MKQLYVFGDSLSDTGTVFRATGGMYPSDPPYFQGRYSNGLVWVEYLANRLSIEHVNNAACGGATTANDGSMVPGLLAQVQAFKQKQRQADNEALYILWAGANDYLQGVNDTTRPVANIVEAIATLSSLGAQRILVANLPDLGHLPATRFSGNSSLLSRLSEAHNVALRRALKQLQQQHSHLQIAAMDAYKLYEEAIAQPAAFGFAQVTQACLAGTRPAGNPEQFLFWDSIHPTTAAHRHLAEAALTAIKAAGIQPTGPILLA
ncbi:SGNH/GDSL hydrolase family protein [Leptolyngbya sp. FACHB-16]|nr:SGNH/GDSL hydrolase family protein [Leptolyngbya sp. FACHB-16]